jgi:hypothetical protein
MTPTFASFQGSAPRIGNMLPSISTTNASGVVGSAGFSSS